MNLIKPSPYFIFKTKEKVQKWSLIVASYGKGYYIYTGLSLFRELPKEFLVHIEY
jgi:hypothetical protein